MFVVIAAAYALLAAAPAAPASVRAAMLYPLSDSAEALNFGWAPMSWDGRAGELYVVGSHGVEVFNENGMAVYSFNDSNAYGRILSVAVLQGGDLLLLATKDARTFIARSNFRGEPRGELALHGVPAALAAEFTPSSLFVARGRLYLADQPAMKVIVAGLDGAYERDWDLQQLASVEEKKREPGMMRGFSVDRDGNMLFTVSTLFQAFEVSPEGRVRSFGMKGSLPGKFNVVGGIAADEDGHLFLTDTLRCVVMVFDRQSLAFLGEFGNGGRGAARNLISPLDLAVGNGRVYVAQSIGSVKVFGVQFD